VGELKGAKLKGCEKRGHSREGKREIKIRKSGDISG
jgi:hypothetical protein